MEEGEERRDIAPGGEGDRTHLDEVCMKGCQGAGVGLVALYCTLQYGNTVQCLGCKKAGH